MLLKALSFAAALALAGPISASTITWTATLGPEAVGATGSGSTTIIYDDVAHTLDISANWSGLSGTTSVAHIHCCVATPGTGSIGVAVTPSTLPGFPVGVTSGTYDIVLDLTASATYTSSFVTTFGGGTIAGAEAALIAGLNGGVAYFNIHSSTFGGGEIRGFPAVVPEPSIAGLLLSIGLASSFARSRNNRA
ncbi:MAG TPA: CHRD domain-containing protein [Myxococcota bacterium]|nr:CHRD domain-containing protein [Myxococcota bacterium]